MDRVARALDQCLAQVAAGMSPDAALATVADDQVRRDVALLLAAALDLTTTSFGTPRPAFRADLARYLSDVELVEPQSAPLTPAARLGRPLLAGVFVVLVLLAGTAGWTVLGGVGVSVNLPQPTAEVPAWPTLPATSVARQAVAQLRKATAPALAPTPEPSVRQPLTAATGPRRVTPRGPSETAAAPASPTTVSPPTASATGAPDDAGTTRDTPEPTASPRPRAPTAVVFGQVLHDDVPLAGVRVVALRSEPGARCPDAQAAEVGEARSDVNGDYRLSGLPPGDYRVFAEGGPACLPRRWHLGQLAESADDACRGTTLDLTTATEIGFVNLRFRATDGGSCPSPTP